MTPTERTIREALDAAGITVSLDRLRHASPHSWMLARPRAVVAAALRAEGYSLAQIGDAIGLKENEAISAAAARGKRLASERTSGT